MIYDVIVVGLGTAGSIAAITAGRKGLKVLAIDRLNCVGGTGTAGAILGYYYGSSGGLFESIDHAVINMGKEDYTPSHGINGELKLYLLEQELVKAGVEVRYECTVTGVLLDNENVNENDSGSVNENDSINRIRVKGIQFISPDGVKEVHGKIIIDCTGEAEVCNLAKCETKMGRSIDNQGQPFTNSLILLRNGKVVNTNTDAGYVDQTNERQLSKAIIESSISPIHLRDKYEEKEKILRVATMLGIREGRVIIGEENVAFEDFVIDKVTKHPIFYAYSNVDNHGKDIALESELQQDWAVVSGLWGINFSVGVPLGALIPKGYDGIMVAGRCLAVDHDISCAIRMKKDMQKCGEAAATAAYLSIIDDISVKDIDYEQLAKLLKNTHCLDEENNVGMKVKDSYNDRYNESVRWLTDMAEIESALNSEKPGIAIWSARRLGNVNIDKLNDWMNEGYNHFSVSCNEQLRYSGEYLNHVDIRNYNQSSLNYNDHLMKHSAFALGLLGDKECLPVLREMLAQRDSFVPKTSKSYNQPRGYVAIYLIGKLKDVESVPELINIICDGSEFKNIDISSSEFILSVEEHYFQYFSHAVSALLKIGRRHEIMRKIIRDALKRAFDREDLSLVISLKAAPYSKYSMKNKMKEIVKYELEEWEKKRGT